MKIIKTTLHGGGIGIGIDVVPHHTHCLPAACALVEELQFWCHSSSLIQKVVDVATSPWKIVNVVHQQKSTKVCQCCATSTSC